MNQVVESVLSNTQRKRERFQVNVAIVKIKEASIFLAGRRPRERNDTDHPQTENQLVQC